MAAATDPWKYGSHRVSIMRKIGDEETVLIESYARSHDEAMLRLDAYLGAIRKHKADYNKLVVMAARKQLSLIEHRIETRGEELRVIEAKLAAHQGNGSDQSSIVDEGA